VDDETSLIDQALGGDTAAFGQLVRRYQDRLFTSVMHVVGHREEAEDLVQETFVRALTKLDTFRQDSSFFTWIYRIALNAAVNRNRRRRSPLPLDTQRDGEGRDPADPGETPHDRVLRLERAEQIRRALHQLSEEYRIVLVLREIDGFDYDTIGRILDISIGTVRSRLHRARALMRDQLGRVFRRSFER
jgi:RNA polymerase sigma-70 factor, ECF subfamily